MRVVSQNVWALPFGLSRDVGSRLAAIGEALPGLEADVVSLQEVWTAQALRSLVGSGRRAGLAHAGFEGSDSARGGLLVLSRFPITEARFETYGLRGLPERVWNGDYFANKGFIELRLTTPAGAVVFIDTHLVARYSETAERDAYFHHRVGQAVQLGTRLAEVRDPLIAAGDFNIREREPEYRVLVGLAGLQDAAVETDSRWPTILASNPYRGGRDARIDYVFTRAGARSDARPISLARVLDGPLEIAGHPGAPSDHAGLVADVELEAKAAAGPPDPKPSATQTSASTISAAPSRCVSRPSAWS